MTEIITRNIELTAQEIINSAPVLTILGARQVGKSTLSKQLTAERIYRYVSLDDANIRTVAENDPALIATANQDEITIIDEFQRVPNLVLAVKDAIEHNRRAGQFILTGSANPATFSSTPDSLAGRAVDAVLWGFSQGEINGHFDDFVTRVKQSETGWQNYRSTLVRDDYIRILGESAFPDVRNSSGRMKTRKLDSYIERVVTHDVKEIHKLESSEKLQILFSLISSQQASELVPNSLAKTLGISPHTVGTYLRALEAMYQIVRLPAFGRNLAKQATTKSKAYISDSALALRLSRVTTEYLSTVQGANYFGGFLEGFVAMELVKQQTWSNTDFKISHFREGGDEVDIVIQLENGNIFGIEIKASSSFSHSDFKGLKALKEKLGPQFQHGIVLYTGATTSPYGTDLTAMPISALWEL